MNTTNRTYADDQIDLKEIVLTLWKEKFIILIITLIFTVAGYIYGTLQPKIYQVTITLRDVPEGIFEKYKNLIGKEKLSSTEFNNEFKINLASLNNLLSFVKQNKKLDEFKSYLKTNNIETEDYFWNKLKTTTGKNSTLNQYSFTFSKPFPAKDFLSDYIFYTKQITENEFNKQYKDYIETEVEIYKQNLEIAKKLSWKILS